MAPSGGPSSARVTALLLRRGLETPSKSQPRCWPGRLAESEVSARVSQPISRPRLRILSPGSDPAAREGGLGLVLQDASVVGASALGLHPEAKGARAGIAGVCPLGPWPHLRVPAWPWGRVSHHPCHAWRPAHAAEANAGPGAKREWARFCRAPGGEEARGPARWGPKVTPGPACTQRHPAHRARPMRLAAARGSSAATRARGASDPACSAATCTPPPAPSERGQRP